MFNVLSFQPLSRFCTYKTGGSARFIAPVTDIDGLFRAHELSDNRLVLGKGSKVLISDDGFDGVVLLMRMNAVTLGSEGVYAEAGVSLPRLSRLYKENGLSGLEWACGIPASLGGAVRLNAGAYGGDMAGAVLHVDVLRGGRKVRLSKEQCGFSYRFSALYPSDIVLGALLRAQKGARTDIKAEMDLFTKQRKAAQPTGRSCGSVFKSGEKPAYRYILDAGLGGLQVGGARVSDKHANFILADSGCTSRDIYTLISTLKAEVYLRLGVRLTEEVIYVGDF